MASFLRRASKLVSSTLKLQPERTLTGTDLQGNKYYEVLPQKYFFGMREVNKEIRIVEPYGGSTRPMAATMKVTSEWEAWLRKKRNNPPSLDELQRNVEKSNVIQDRVVALEEQEYLAKREAELLSPKKQFGSSPAQQKSENESQTVDSWQADKS